MTDEVEKKYEQEDRKEDECSKMKILRQFGVANRYSKIRNWYRYKRSIQLQQQTKHERKKFKWLERVLKNKGKEASVSKECAGD